MAHIDKDEPLKGHGPSDKVKEWFGAKAKDPADMEHASPSATGSKIPEMDSLWRIRAEIQRVAGQNAAENPNRKTILKDLRRLEQQAEDAVVGRLTGEYNINIDPKAFDLDITTKEDARIWNRIEADGGRYQEIPGYENHTVRYDRKERRYVQPNLDGPASGYHEFTPDKATTDKFREAFLSITESENTNFNNLLQENPKPRTWSIDSVDDTYGFGLTDDEKQKAKETDVSLFSDKPGSKDKDKDDKTGIIEKVPHTHVWDGHAYTPNTLGGEKYVERHGDYATHKGVFRKDIRGISRFQRWDEDATKERMQPTAGDKDIEVKETASVDPPFSNLNEFDAYNKAFNADLKSISKSPFSTNLNELFTDRPTNTDAFSSQTPITSNLTTAENDKPDKDKKKGWNDMTGGEKLQAGAKVMQEINKLTKLFEDEYYTSGWNKPRSYYG